MRVSCVLEFSISMHTFKNFYDYTKLIFKNHIKH